MSRKALFVIIFVVSLGIVAAVYVYMEFYAKKNPTCKDLKTEIKTTASDLITESEKMDTAVNRKYNDKVLEISGKVSSTIPGDSITSVILGQSNTDITVEICNMDNQMSKYLKVGDDVTVKALYITYMPADPILISMGDSTARGSITLKKGSFIK